MAHDLIDTHIYMVGFGHKLRAVSSHFRQNLWKQRFNNKKIKYRDFRIRGWPSHISITISMSLDKTILWDYKLSLKFLRFGPFGGVKLMGKGTLRQFDVESNIPIWPYIPLPNFKPAQFGCLEKSANWCVAKAEYQRPIWISRSSIEGEIVVVVLRKQALSSKYWPSRREGNSPPTMLMPNK